MKDLKQFIKTTIREFLNENISNKDVTENFIVSGKDFKKIYATDFGGKVAKVLLLLTVFVFAQF